MRKPREILEAILGACLVCFVALWFEAEFCQSGLEVSFVRKKSEKCAADFFLTVLENSAT